MIFDGLMYIHNFVRFDDTGGGNPVLRAVYALQNIRRFNTTLRFLRDSQWRSFDWHSEYQRKKLHRLMKFSVDKIPYYNDFARSRGIDPKMADFAEILDKFPILNESYLRSNFNGFVSERIGNEDYINMALSRRYSERFYLPVDTGTFLKDKALVARHYENVGFRIGAPILCFVNEIEGFEDGQFRFDKTSNRYYFSSNNLCRGNLANYCKKIKEIDAGFAFGYPSSLEKFSEFILEWEVEMKFQGVITSGEVLTDAARKKIESAFNTKVYDLYHYSFPVLGMGQCQYCEGYHLFSEYCVLELIGFDGKRVRERGRIGRLVVTNISNYAFPLIRFDTGDMGIYDGNECDCGRGLPKIIGRISGSQKDLLISSDGDYILPGALQEMFSEAGYTPSGYQLVQEKRNKFKLKLVRGPEYMGDNLDKIKGRLLERLGESSYVVIEPVNRISGDGRKPKSIVREYDPG